jgi:hypothetical protein
MEEEGWYHIVPLLVRVKEKKALELFLCFVDLSSDKIA